MAGTLEMNRSRLLTPKRKGLGVAETAPHWIVFLSENIFAFFSVYGGILAEVRTTSVCGSPVRKSPAGQVIHIP